MIKPANRLDIKVGLFCMNIYLVSVQRLEWTKVRTGENAHGAIEFNKLKKQCGHPFVGSEQ
jgi:hypothetical protein